MRTRVVTWAVLTTLIILVLGVFAYERIERRKLPAARRLGDQIVSALRAYKDRHACFPASLDDLVPECVSAIEQPSWGTGSWIYYRKSCDECQLSVAANSDGYPVLFHVLKAREGQWTYDD